jgi:hypothetical protein
MHTNLLLKVLSGVALDLKNGATAHQFGNLCPPSTKLSLKKVIKYSNFTVNAYTTQPHSYFFLHENGIHDSIKNMGSLPILLQKTSSLVGTSVTMHLCLRA